MNFDNMNILSQKVEGVLSTVRNLRAQVATLQQDLATAQAEAHDKSMLLDVANKDLVDCKAALDARANQAQAQDDTLNALHSEIETLNARLIENTGVIELLNNKLSEQEATIESLNKQLSESTGSFESVNNQLSSQEAVISSLNAQIAEKNEQFESLNAQVAEKDSQIESLNIQLSEKASALDEKEQIIASQGEEIAEAQERFQQLLATIEKELGTEIPIDHAEENLDNEPTIVVHRDDDKDNDLFASDGGSQGGFFG